MEGCHLRSAFDSISTIEKRPVGFHLRKLRMDKIHKKNLYVLDPLIYKV
jgi:hypothetical protein